MSKGEVKHAFPGGNTSQGFFSFYDYILSQDDARRIIVIKGGPGVGKSTFMKKIGNEMVDRGFNVEYMHCSSDNNSLDGLVIPAIGVALLDGTTPHVVDPKNPGAVDEILHLGDFWDEAGIRGNKEKILKINKEVGNCFARAYKYIKAAASIHEDTAVINGWALDNAKVNTAANEICEEVFKGKKTANKEGRIRRLFASAITPDGYKNYISSLLTTKYIYVLKGESGTGTETMLEKIKQNAVERGYYVEAYYCALNPLKLEHLVIQGLKTSFTTVNEFHNSTCMPYKEVDFNEFLNKEVINEYEKVLEYNKCEFRLLMDKAIETIGKAKALHDEMEAYYIPNMDFGAVQLCYEATLDRILEYAKEIN